MMTWRKRSVVLVGALVLPVALTQLTVDVFDLCGFAAFAVGFGFGSVIMGSAATWAVLSPLGWRDR